MKRYTINYEETYSGTFTVELNDDSTEQDAINELLDNAYEYRPIVERLDCHRAEELELTK